jgi:hypothetical protein
MIMVDDAVGICVALPLAVTECNMCGTVTGSDRVQKTKKK